MKESLFYLAFWDNRDISRTSRVILVSVLCLIPGTFILATYFVEAANCIGDLMKLFGLVTVLLITYSAYFWVVDRPKVLRTFSRLVDEGQAKIRKVGGKYQLSIGGRYQGHISLGVIFGSSTLYLVALVFICWWPPSLSAICQSHLTGRPPVPPVAAGVSFLIVIMHVLLLWIYSTIPVWRYRASRP